MVRLLLIVLTAMTLALWLTPVARMAALRTGTVDRPDEKRPAGRAVPLLGGMAIYLAVVTATLVFFDQRYISELTSILVGATFVSLLGLWDDGRPLRPGFKLLGQLAAAGGIVAAGVQIQLFAQAGWLNGALTVLWVVGITNAMNLLDNMDGLSGGVAAVAAGSFLLLAAANGQYLVGALSAAVLGACLGFLRYNLNPARIFMGDSGSLLLGFVLACIGIKLRFPGADRMVTWMVPILVLGVPIFDTTLVVMSRLRRRVPVYLGGKDHFSHRLLGRGWTDREVVLLCSGLGTVLGGIALFVSQVGRGIAYPVGAMVVLSGCWGIWRMERTGERGRGPG